MKKKTKQNFKSNMSVRRERDGDGMGKEALCEYGEEQRFY